MVARPGTRFDRRTFLGLALLPLVPWGRAEADHHEPWRELIPKTPPPPTLPDGEAPSPAAVSRLARATAAALARDDGWVMPSGWYPMLFTRDAYWIVAAHGDRAVHAAVLARLRAEQLPSGQAPTALYIDGYHPDGRDQIDESTLLYVLMSFDAFRLGATPDRPSLERAAAWLTRRATRGRYASEPGPYAYWLDTLALAGEAPCVTYVQGLLAVALRALAEMGIAGGPSEPAEAQYRAGFDPDLGQMRCYADVSGRFGQLRDISALTGEALSWYYFGRPILDSAAVGATLAAQPRGHYADGAFVGFKNLTQADGGPLPIEWLNGWAANTPDDYQNGASWLLYDALALYAGVRHRVPGAPSLFRQRLVSELRRGRTLHEYLSTSPRDPGATDSKRDGYGWNGFVANLIDSTGGELG